MWAEANTLIKGLYPENPLNAAANPKAAAITAVPHLIDGLRSSQSVKLGTLKLPKSPSTVS
ncbi:MAG: hypothetical protein KME05_19540 [Gloeocapsa sp. UFS-A4-WI-NPMV-4B04]|jgi:hypothetical protein|nr:hypothetical protein [Gloeocapsa sp. UFS-A4-WI-NPMV-4B04]